MLTSFLRVVANTRLVRVSYSMRYDWPKASHVEAVMTARSSFGHWLKQRCKTLDVTREGLARRVGCAEVTLYKIEMDERRPSKQMAERLAEQLNIPADQRTTFVRFARADSELDAALWGRSFRPQTNLPAQPTQLIGREADASAIYKRLLQPE